ncbi:hypothetical protein D9619_004883 [Psilocybe cf. subviscida]|uniref:Uncharacterized protein n=1 Tax=Psilocybe cf. subviscida TaxID=2480587 RepID=A0A8H5F7Y8_9AGAR|nr:hypothetical protein D9619_004883 [Psilocybe cf. subviscida]
MSSAPPSPNALVITNPFTSSPNPSSTSIAGNSLIPPSNANPTTSGASTSQVPLAERADVHKACKTLEGLLSVLNEYCEAASAICALQKRMAKALRETAACKVTGEVPGNALQAAASIFDALAEADSRFAKGADREYDAISGEVKKWFKKLAKEEKNHDERMANANAKIKQAGQVYEKKSKRKGSDAVSVTDEHARYIALISTLGPEIAQDKYNHALLITHRHNTTTLSVAGSLGRIADGEWLRLCECVRRCAPTIGPLGQWRALCEGSWLGGVPVALAHPTETQPSPTAGDSNIERDVGGREGAPLKPIEEESAPAPAAQKPLASPGLEAPLFNPPGYSSGPPSAATSSQDLTLAGQQQKQQQQLQEPKVQAQAQEQRARLPSATNSPALSRNAPLPTSDASRAFNNSNNGIDNSGGLAVNDNDNSTNSQPLYAPRPPFALADGVDPNTGSVRSLSAFPAPPTHYPQAPRQRSGLGLNTDAVGMAQAHSLASIPSSGLGVPAPSNAPGGGGRSPTSNDIPRRLTESPRQASSDVDDGRGGYALSSGRRDVDREVEIELQQDREDARDRELELQRELEEIQGRRNADQLRRPVPVKAHTSLPLDARGPVSGARHGGYSSVDLRSGQGYRGDRHDGDDETREFGVLSSNNNNAYRSSNDDTPRARGVGDGQGRYNNASMRPLPMEQADTGMSSSSGTGSLVAAMRNRYSVNSGSLSPTPRDLPKLPLGGNGLAGRYEGNNNGDAPLSPNLSPRARSPPVARQQSLPLLAAPGQRTVTAQDVYQARRLSAAGLGVQQQSPNDDQVERRAKDLMERERELEARAQALERDRLRLQNLRNGRSNDVDAPPERDTSNTNDEGGQFALRPRERRTSLRHPLQRPASQMSGAGDETDLRQRYAYGTAQVASSSGSPTTAAFPLKQPPPQTDGRNYDDKRRNDRDRYAEQNARASASGSSNTNMSSHASNCGCEACSISKYKAAGKSGPDQQLKQHDGRAVAPERQRVDSKPEKTKSWMRRLSMPGVGNAFMSDSKKGSGNGSSTNYGLGSGVGHTPEKSGRGLFSLKNSSTTGLRQSNDIDYRRTSGIPDENLRAGAGVAGRRSYDVGGTNNRSMTNLGIAGRH